MATGAATSTIVVGVDGSPASDAAVRWAAHEALMRSMPMDLVHVVTRTVFSSVDGPTITQLQINEARQILATSRTIAEKAAGTMPLDIRTGMQYDGIVPTLADASTGAWMIVVGSRGLDALEGHLLGSVSSQLIHHAHCPTAIVHDPQSVQQEIRDDAPVLVGIDGSPASEAATALAFDEASRRGVPLVALHAWSDVGVFAIAGMDWREYRDEGEEVLAERLAGWHDQYPDVQVQRKLVCDVPARWLIDESKRAQLVIVGSRGRGGHPEKHLGSVGHAVAHSARVPVIITPAPDDRPPHPARA